MIKSGKTAIFASLFLGATLVGGTGAGAAPFSNMPTSVQSEALTKNTDVKKVELLLGLGIGALIGGLFVHETDRYYNHSHHGHRYHGYRYHNSGKKKYARHHRRYKSKSPHHKSIGHKRVHHH